MLREDAYRIVQKNAHAAFDEQVLFDKKIKADEQITQLFTSDELDDLFSYAPTLLMQMKFLHVYMAANV